MDDNILTVTGAKHFYGTDQILVQVFDSHRDKDFQIVNVEVIPVNDPPVLGDIQPISFNEGESTKI